MLCQSGSIFVQRSAAELQPVGANNQSSKGNTKWSIMHVFLLDRQYKMQTHAADDWKLDQRLRTALSLPALQPN